MLNLISRIESRIRAIEALLGPAEVSKEISSKNTSAPSFDNMLKGTGESKGFGPLPPVGNLGAGGLFHEKVDVKPFRPETVRPLGAQGENDGKLDALSAILKEEAEEASRGVGDLTSILPALSPLNGFERKRGLNSPRSPLSLLNEVENIKRGNALDKALKAYKTGQGVAAPNLEDLLPKQNR